MEETLLHILEKLTAIQSDVAVCRAKLGWYKWQFTLFWSGLLALTGFVINISLRR
jgi:hypothetical protein